MAGVETAFLIWSLESEVDTEAPRVSGAAALQPKQVEVSFSEPMDQTGPFLDEANYDIDDAMVSVESVLPFGAYKARLIVTELADGKEYQVTVNTALQDVEGNTLDPTAVTATFIGTGSAPTLSSIQVISDTRVRVFFSEPMRDDPDLRATSNYVITSLTGGVDMFVSRIEPESNEVNPTFVDLIVTEGTNAEDYEVTVSNVKDVAGNVIGTPNVDSFTATGTPPVIEALQAISINRVDVIFNEPIQVNAFALDPANYVWDNGLSTVEVIEVDGNRAKLVTTDQDPDTLYTLTVTP